MTGLTNGHQHGLGRQRSQIKQGLVGKALHMFGHAMCIPLHSRIGDDLAGKHPSSLANNLIDQLKIPLSAFRNVDRGILEYETQGQQG